MDFVHDQLATGRKLRVLTIVDTFSRFSPALEPRFTFRGADVVEVLERVGRRMGFPQRSGSIKAVSLYPAIWICGLTVNWRRSGTPPLTRFNVDLPAEISVGAGSRSAPIGTPPAH